LSLNDSRGGLYLSNLKILSINCKYLLIFISIIFDYESREQGLWKILPFKALILLGLLSFVVIEWPILTKQAIAWF